MWQCKYCHERFIEPDPNHICVDDSLSGHFKGRRATLESLFKELIRQLQRHCSIKTDTSGSFISLNEDGRCFSLIRVGTDRLEIFVNLSDQTPVPPAFHRASQLKIAGMTHYTDVASISDLNKQMLRTIVAASKLNHN